MTTRDARTANAACRPAHVGDLDEIAGLFLECWNISYTEVLPIDLVRSMTPARAASLWSHVLAQSGPDEVMVAEAAVGPPRLLGVTRWTVATGALHEGVVQSLYVAPSAQGQGVGSLLLTEASRALLQRGATTARLWVFRDNTPAISFYRHQGWHPDGATRSQAEFDQPEIRLARSLGA